MKQVLKVGLIMTLSLAVAVTAASAKSKRSAWLGVYMQTVDADLAEAYDLPVKSGVIINDIVEDSPADEAGLVVDDIVVAIDGSQVASEEDLIDLIAKGDPGKEVVLSILRGGDKQDLTVTLGRKRDHEDDDVFRSFTPGSKSYSFSYNFSDDDYPYIGVSLLNISEDLAAHFGAGDRGALINEVEEDSPAAKAELKPGDVIVAVGDDPVADAGDVQEAIRDLDKGDVARLEIIRNKRRMRVEVEVALREGGKFGRAPRILQIPDLPQIDMKAPRMKGLRHGDDADLLWFDSDELRDDMERLKKDLKELKKELQELRKSLE